MGYILLGLVLEEVSGRSWSEVVMDGFLVPLRRGTRPGIPGWSGPVGDSPAIRATWWSGLGTATKAGLAIYGSGPMSPVWGHA